MAARRLDHCIIAVSDWQRATAFYRDVLGAEVIPQDSGRMCFRIGDTQLNVHGPGVTPAAEVARLPVRPGNSDLCFVWDGTVEGAVDHLQTHGVEVETGPVERFGAAGRGTSVYFRDPDGSLLEFIVYERGFNTRAVEQESAAEVAASFAGTPDDRLRQIMTSLVHHAHAFVEDVGLTTDEWAAGIRFLTETGHTCSDTRQEFILLSDVFGVSMLVEALGNPTEGRFTEATVEGPFHMVASPERELGDTIDERGAGEPCLVTGRVVDGGGRPVAEAHVDVWQADADGFYDVQRPGVVPDRNLRGLFTTDRDGQFWFRSVVPRHYPIPTDGPVGRLLDATRRHPYRAAHIHVEVSAPGTRTLTTHIFVAGSPYLDSDAVFGVKPGLIREFTTVDDPARAAEHGLPNPFRWVDFPITVRGEG